MNAQGMPVTTNLLRIRNPYRIYGAIVFATGCILGFLVLKRSPVILEALPKLAESLLQITKNPDVLQRSRWEDVIAIIVLGLWGLFFIRAALHSLLSLVRGMSRMLIFFVPAGIPGPLDQAENTLRELFLQKNIPTYSAPTFPLRVLGGIFSTRFRYTRGECRDLAENLYRSIPIWLFVLLFLSVPRLLPAQVMQRLVEQTGIPQGVLETWPLPFHLAIVAGFVTLIRMLGILSSVPRVPRVEVYEGREHLENTGNPVNFFNHLEATIDQVRHQTFANRKVVDRAPSLGRTLPGETCQYDSRVVFETQPLPVWSGLSVNAVILDLAGSALRCAGYAAIIFPEAWVKRGSSQLGLIEIIFQVLAALVAIRVGTRFLSIGWRLHQAFRFESDVFWISLTGTYTASSIGVGDGRGGQLYSHRAAIQSDSYIHLYGATILTETMPQHSLDVLKCPRIILDSRSSAKLGQRLDHLRQAMISFTDSGGRLAGVDVSASSVQRIVAANAQINQINQNPKLERLLFPQSVEKSADQIVSSNTPPEGMISLPLAEVGDLKGCPECGEKVKKIAKKCRFCGQRFDTEGSNGMGDSKSGGSPT